MEKKLFTPKALKYLSYSLLFLLLATILSHNTFNLFYQYITGVYLPSTVGWMIFVPLVLFSSAGAIILILGIYVLWRGKNEFGKEHTTNVERGIWVIMILLSAATFICSGPLSAQWYESYVLFFIQNLMLLLIPVFLIKSLINRNINIMLWVAIFAFVILYPLWYTLFYVIHFQYYDVYPILLLSKVIPYLLLTFCYYKTYIEVKSKKIKTA